jgi:hypothetical protein
MYGCDCLKKPANPVPKPTIIEAQYLTPMSTTGIERIII